jgi:hypothetical protein
MYPHVQGAPPTYSPIRSRPRAALAVGVASVGPCGAGPRAGAGSSSGRAASTSSAESCSRSPIEVTRSVGSNGALVALSALLLSAFATPPALAQGGGVSAPISGGVLAPDPAPQPAAPEPDAAPGAGSDSVQAAPPPESSPAPATPPDTTSSAPAASIPAASPPSQPATPRARQPRRHASPKHAAQKARENRNERQHDRRSTIARASPASVFGVNHALVRGVGGSTKAEPPPVELVAWALLTLVLAAAALLTLTARLSRMEGLTGPMPPDTQWLRRLFHVARFAPHGSRRAPAA